tara:strand:+ start:15348 stop:15572 length:225 start_codon:yes stop_codon:yes gene_type:complete
MVKVKIKSDRVFVNGERAVVGKSYEVSDAEAKLMIANGHAEKGAAKAQKKRARNKDGTLKADDPKTPDVNEAWE